MKLAINPLALLVLLLCLGAKPGAQVTALDDFGTFAQARLYSLAAQPQARM